MCPPLDPRREVYKQISTSSPSPLASMLIFSLETTFLQLEKKIKKNKKNYMHRDFAMQRGEGSIPAQETKIPHAVRHSRVTQNKEFTI